MQIILKKDVEKLGYKNDVVQVKAGYANNYLIPQGLAMIANRSNKKIREENIRQAAHKEAKLQADAANLAAKLALLPFKVAVEAAEGKVFGTITPLQIASALKEKQFDIDAKQIQIPTPIKTIGKHKVNLQLYKSFKSTLEVEVVAK